MPPSASSVAADVDLVFALIFWISAFFFALIVGLVLVFVLRYRQRRWVFPQPSATHSMRLELTWSIVPLLLVVLIFGFGTRVYLDMTEARAAEPEMQIQVTARKWSWWFDYPGGKGSNDLHVPPDQPVELVMNAQDVIHSFYVPAFRLKQDLVPGRYTKMRFTATRPGTYQAYCAELCGTNHSQMLAKVVVHADLESFDAWLLDRDDETMPLVDVGHRVVLTRGCNTCHSTDGGRRVGPTLLGLWGRSEGLADGTRVTVDENYIRESILDPRAKIVAGFGPVMPPTVLSDREIQGVIEYIKSLRP